MIEIKTKANQNKKNKLKIVWSAEATLGPQGAAVKPEITRAKYAKFV